MCSDALFLYKTPPNVLRRRFARCTIPLLMFRRISRVLVLYHMNIKLIERD